MTGPGPGAPLPVRVVVKGDSAVVWSSWMGGPRTDFIFPRALEASLLSAGRPAEVRTYASPSERSSLALGSWEQQTLGYSPDVVILAYGLYDSIHLVLPRWFQRFVHSESSRPGRWRDAARRRLVKPAYTVVGKIQARIDSRPWPGVARRRAARAAANLERLISRMRRVGSPLIIVLDVLPPGQNWQRWFPGMSDRVHALNAAVRTMVENVGERDVRWISVAGIAARSLDPTADLTPDGGHYTPELHRAIGVHLGREVGEWAQQQPHLAG